MIDLTLHDRVVVSLSLSLPIALALLLKRPIDQSVSQSTGVSIWLTVSQSSLQEGSLNHICKLESPFALVVVAIALR